LIAREVVDARAFALFFARLRMAGFDPNDFATNGLHLPSTETNAIAFRLPLHRGPHPRYNEMVADYVGEFMRLHPLEALAGISNLQNDLRAGLRMNAGTNIELLRYPMRPQLKADFEVAGLQASQLSHVGRLL
jgi:hypothetical protein